VRLAQIGRILLIVDGKISPDEENMTVPRDRLAGPV
jgi:hypothetical protein